MRHEQYKEWIQLGLYEELTAEERNGFDAHLQECSECRAEAAAIERMRSVLETSKPPVVDDALLAEARQELRAALRLEKNRRSAWSSVRESLSWMASPRIGMAVGAVAVLAIGLFGGYWYANRQQVKYFDGGRQTASVQNGWGNVNSWPENSQPAAEEGGNAAPGGITLDREDSRITNVKILENDPGTGSVEFTFDAISPMHIKGNVNDPRVQKVLTHALLNAENPGVRLRSVTAIASRSDAAGISADKDVKTALIKALQGDNNPAVRKEALRALQKLPLDGEIKKAFLAALVKDNNAGIRIAIINSLDSMKTEGTRLDNDVLEVLKQKMNNDDNNYIRLRAKAAVQEIHQ